MTLKKITLVFLAFVSLCIIQNHGKRGYEILMNSYNCTVNPIYAIAPVCYLNKTFNPARAYFDIRIQNDIQTLQYSWILWILKNKSNKRRKVLSVKNMNGCEFLEGISVIPFLNILRIIMLKFGTMPQKCPLKKDSRFVFNDLIIDSKEFPPYMPETKFVITVNTTSGRNFIFAVTADGKVMQKFNIYG